MNSQVTLPPRTARMLLELTKQPRTDLALYELINEFVELKKYLINQKIKQYEKKWKMDFKEFSKACKENTLGQDPYSFEVEEDYREWEALITLRQYYEEIKNKCII